MRIQLNLKFLFLFLILTQVIIAQDIESKQQEPIFKTIAPRIGLGIHDNLNCEFGVSALYISNRALQWGAASLYSTFVLQSTDCNSRFNMTGFKIGVQSSWAIFMCGIEWKMLNYKNDKYNFLSPKIGLSLLDVVNIEYLINVLDIIENNPLQSKHQIAINFSLNRKIYNNIWKK